MKQHLTSLSVFLATTVLVSGCASKTPLTTPNGEWQPINQKGFIPKGVKRYIEDVDIVIEDGKPNFINKSEGVANTTTNDLINPDNEATANIDQLRKSFGYGDNHPSAKSSESSEETTKAFKKLEVKK